MWISPASLVESWAVVFRRPKTQATLRAFQSARLRQLVRHAYASVRYYRRLFDEVGLKPDDIQGVEDLPKIPLSSRDDLQFLPADQICARRVDPNSLLVRRTSGTSGAPLSIRRHRLEERLLQALRLWYVSKYGGSWRSHRAEIRHLSSRSDWDSVPERPFFYQRLGFFRRTVIPWNEPKEEIVDQLATAHTEILVGAPSILSWRADELSDRDRERLSILYVITGGEMLSDEVRDRIEKGWGARVRTALTN